MEPTAVRNIVEPARLPFDKPRGIVSQAVWLACISVFLAGATLVTQTWSSSVATPVWLDIGLVVLCVTLLLTTTVLALKRHQRVRPVGVNEAGAAADAVPTGDVEPCVPPSLLNTCVCELFLRTFGLESDQPAARTSHGECDCTALDDDLPAIHGVANMPRSAVENPSPQTVPSLQEVETC